MSSEDQAPAVAAAAAAAAGDKAKQAKPKKEKQEKAPKEKAPKEKKEKPAAGAGKGGSKKPKAKDGAADEKDDWQPPKNKDMPEFMKERVRLFEEFAKRRAAELEKKGMCCLFHALSSLFSSFSLWRFFSFRLVSG